MQEIRVPIQVLVAWFENKEKSLNLKFKPNQSWISFKPCNYIVRYCWSIVAATTLPPNRNLDLRFGGRIHSLPMATRSLDGENEESLHFPKLLLPQCGWSIRSWRTWWLYTLWHDPSDPGFWLDARGTISQPWAVSLQAIRRPRVLSNISPIAIHGRCRELQLRIVAGQVCKPRSHIYRELQGKHVLLKRRCSLENKLWWLM
jgi:hypothetical protein